MTLHDEILARADCNAAVAAKDCNAIAALVSAGRTEARSRFVTARTILSECGALGPSILDALEAVAATAGGSAVKWALKFLSQDSGLDVGHPATQAMIGQLATAGALSAAQASALTALANQPAPVSAHDVAMALFNIDGTIK